MPGDRDVVVIRGVRARFECTPAIEPAAVLSAVELSEIAPVLSTAEPPASTRPRVERRRAHFYPALGAGLAFVVVTAACFPASIACDPKRPHATCPAPLVCVEEICTESSLGEGEGAAGEGEGAAGEGEGEGAPRGCELDAATCTADQYCVDVDSPERGTCVPPAGTVTICENTTGTYTNPTNEAPAIFDGASGADGDPAACAGSDIGPVAMTVAFDFFDVEGDVAAEPTDVIVYMDGFNLPPISFVEQDTASGAAGSIAFTVCVPAGTPSVAVELHDASGHASNGFCILH